MHRFHNVHIIKKLNAPDSDIVVSVLRIIEEICNERDIEIVDVPKNSSTLVIAIGGDGTMIFAAKEAVKVNASVIGFNTGNRGFLTEFPPTRVIDVVNRAIDGNLRSELRSLLTCVSDDGSETTALNEIVISNLYSDHVIEYEIEIDGFSAGTHKSNSVILSTPTGSTAYSLSVGGGISDPALDIIQIIPVAALALASTMRPLIMSNKSEIIVKTKVRKGDTISVKSDGRPSLEFQAEEDEMFCFRLVKAGQKVKFLHEPDWNFFEVLTEKLHWGKG